MAANKLEGIRSEILNGHAKYEATEIVDDHIDAAIEYLGIYGGDFEFVVKVRQDYLKTKKLSNGQAKGILNVYRAEVLREIEREKAKLTQLPDGVYEMGDWKFKIETQAKDADFAAGETIVYLPGKKKPWLGFAFLRGTKLQAWSRYKEDSDSQTLIAMAMLLVSGGVAANAAA